MAFHVNNTAELTLEEKSHDDKVAGGIIFLVSIVGVVCNAYVVFVISRRPSMQNAFGKLTLNQGLGDLLSSFLYLTYYAPMVFFDIKPLQSVAVSRWFAFIHLITYDFVNIIHFFASINRTVVIFFPLSIGRAFGLNTAKWAVLSAWILAIVPAILTVKIPDCPLVYDEDSWHYNFYSSSSICEVLGMYDFEKTAILVMLNVAFDVVTFAKSRCLRKELRTSLASNTVKSRKMDEINFVTQALLQGIVFGAELVFYGYFATFTENRFLKFALTQVAWQSTGTLDGIITICFNKEFRRWIRRSPKISGAYSLNAEKSEKSRKETRLSNDRTCEQTKQ